MATVTMKDRIVAVLKAEGTAGLTNKELATRLSAPEPSVRRTMQEMSKKKEAKQTEHNGQRLTRNKQVVWALA